MIKIFADGANAEDILDMNNDKLIDGFTTNPTLMKKAGVANYQKFAHEILSFVDKKPISFEVFADDQKSMIDQGEKINTWGKNIYVKVPVVNSKISLQEM